MVTIIQGSLPEQIQALCGLQGIFYIEFLKIDKTKYLDDGSLNPDYNKRHIKRTGNFRLGVTKHLKGKKRTTDKEQYLIAYDMKKQGYRNIFYNDIKLIRVNKQEYKINVIDSKHYRLSCIEKTNKEPEQMQFIFEGQ